MSELSWASEVSRSKHNPTQVVTLNTYDLYWDFLRTSYLPHLWYSQQKWIIQGRGNPHMRLKEEERENLFVSLLWWGGSNLHSITLYFLRMKFYITLCWKFSEKDIQIYHSDRFEIFQWRWTISQWCMQISQDSVIYSWWRSKYWIEETWLHFSK